MNWQQLRNSTSFVHDVNEFFKTVKASDGIRYHQALMKEYFLKYPIRGLLVMHKMGMGKTKLAAEIVNVLLESHDVLFISAKTLHTNFENTLSIKNKVKYVSLNASNMFEQVNKASLTDIEKLFSKKKKMRGSLDNVLIVVDEAHNLFNSITNGSQNALDFYKAVIDSNCRVIFLTGSPILNDPFESAVCFNMLTGYALFPENYREFNNYFVAGGQIKNAGKYMNRINGLISYYDGNAKNNKIEFPEKREVIVIECDMSKHQYKQYFEARKIETETKIKKKNGRIREYALQKSKATDASYRVMSRQISNFAYPEYAIEKKHNEKGKVVESANFDLIKEKDVYDNIAMYSPKMKKVIENAISLPGINIIYSQFLKYGLSLIEMYFKYSTTLGKPIKYTVISGEVDKEEVYKRVEAINSPENKNGDIYKVVLISGTASEGVDFKRIMQIHCLEPYWHWSRMEQIFGRGVRANSHVDMPSNMKYVQSYIYLSKHGIKESTEITTDEHLYTKSIKNYKLIESFYLAMRMSAIDCPTHYGECKACLPTNKKLFDDDVVTDMTTGDPCIEQKSTKATIFEYEGETYARYEEDGEVYFAKLNKATGKYEKVPEDIRRLLLSLIKNGNN